MLTEKEASQLHKQTPTYDQQNAAERLLVRSPKGNARRLLANQPTAKQRVWAMQKCHENRQTLVSNEEYCHNPVLENQSRRRGRRGKAIFDIGRISGASNDTSQGDH